MESIIYTHKKLDFHPWIKSVNQKEWITDSINSAKNLGYKTELYTNDIEFSQGLEVDKVHFINDDYEIWDSFKLWVLENRKDTNYFLADNDVIFQNTVPLNNTTDIFFDGIEIRNWNKLYKPTLDYIKKEKLLKEFDYWDFEKIPVYNVGILKINNEVLKHSYIQEWKKIYNILKPHLINLNKSIVTPLITQYLLTLLVNKYHCNFEYFTIDGGWPYNNKYYYHFSGQHKFKITSLI